MERLTEKGHTYHSLEFMEDGIYIWANRLSAYEDTGLAPEEIPTALEMCKIKMALDNLAKYQKLEARLCDMFDGVLTLETAVNELERYLTEPGKPHPTHVRILTYEDAERYDRLREAEDAGLLLKLPCAVGDTVYEVFYDELNNPQYYICKYEVEDVSAKAIKYVRDDWIDLADLRNTYFNREEAEKRLKELAVGGKV